MLPQVEEEVKTESRRSSIKTVEKVNFCIFELIFNENLRTLFFYCIIITSSIN